MNYGLEIILDKIDEVKEKVDQLEYKAQYNKNTEREIEHYHRKLNELSEAKFAIEYMEKLKVR